jgi:hypothetical protein
MKIEKRKRAVKNPQNPWTKDMEKTAAQNRTEHTSRIQRRKLTVSASCPKTSCTHPLVSVKTDPTQMEN